jgi:uncharacterized protein YecT (DUF1311 family)
MTEIIAAVIGAGLVFAFQLLMRRISGEAATEKISRTSDLLDVREKLTRQGTSLEELHNFEDALLSKVRERRKIEDRLTSELANSEQHDPTAYMPQQAMNRYQAHRAAEMSSKLDGTLVELDGYLTDKEKQQLRKAQAAWARFRKAQAEYASLVWDGGSMQPFAYWGEHTSMSIERIAALEEEISERRKFKREEEEL